MLINVNELLGYKILAKDGEIGQVDDLYFDAQAWVLRYLVVDTGPWILGRKVLLSDHAFVKADWTSYVIPVNLTREQVENSPDMDFARPVSRAQETNLFGYYGWPMYWQMPLVGSTPVTAPFHPVTVPVTGVNEVMPAEPLDSEPYIHRFKEVKGYRVHARDGEIGHIEDFVIESEKWTISYFIVDTGGWFQQSHKVMLAPHWITSIDSDSSTVSIDLKKDTIRSSPDFEPDKIVEGQEA